MEATTIIPPGSILEEVDTGLLWLVTVSSNKHPGSFNAYRINEVAEEWRILGERREFTSAEDFKYALVPIITHDSVISMLNGALYQSEELLKNQNEKVIEWANKWEHANAVLVEKAREHDLCHQFDEVAESIGMYGCKRDFDVTFSVTYNVSATITARDEDEAREQIEEWEPNDYLDDRVEEAVRYNTPEIDNIYVEEA